MTQKLKKKQQQQQVSKEKKKRSSHSLAELRGFQARLGTKFVGAMCFVFGGFCLITAFAVGLVTKS